MTRASVKKAQLATRAKLYMNAADWTSYGLECVIYGISVTHWRDAFWWHNLKKTSPVFRWLFDNWHLVSLCILVPLLTAIIICRVLHIEAKLADMIALIITAVILMSHVMFLIVDSLCFMAYVALAACSHKR